MLGSAARASHGLGSLVLLLMQLELNEEFCKHGVDPIQSDIGLTQWMLCMETVPDTTDCSVILRNATQGVIDKCYNGPWDAHFASS